MIVYLANKSRFREDILSNRIEEIVHESFQRQLGKSVGECELASWKHSLRHMDPEAAPIVAEELYLEVDADFDFDTARTWYPHIDGCCATIYEADSELRDTENIPLLYPGGIEAYFMKEVLPHVPDAWIDEEKTAIGYEIYFNKYFYVHKPLRDLAEVVKEIRHLEKETEGLLEQILNFSSSGR